MASTSNQGPNPNRGRKRRRPSTAAVVAGTVGKVLGTFLLICVITGAILLCFAAVYIKTVIIPQAHLEANFVMNQTSTIYYKDSTTGEYVEHLSLHGTENRQLVDFEEIPDNLINATVAIEDETFWKHRRRYSGRLHHHPAAHQECHPVRRCDGKTEDSGDLHRLGL